MNVVLKLSKLCNLRCTYCYEYEHLVDPARMPLDGLAFFFEQLATELTYSGIRRVAFALHGGEPLLLPAAYLRELVALQRRSLGERGIEFENALQTNLYKVPAGIVDLLAELDIALGVSIDVHGGARVTAGGHDAEARVRANLDALLDSGARQRIRVGGISVLHAGNINRAVDTFHFFAERGLGYRILPIFAIADPPARMRHLLIEPRQITDALHAVFLARLAWPGGRIEIHPLEDYFDAAMRHGAGRHAAGYDPRDGEWALIIDTSGDAYTHSEAYNPEFRLGNAFRQPFAELLSSPARRRLLSQRADRARTCEDCQFGSTCSRIPMVEALPSERVRDESGNLTCTVARPLIERLGALLSRSPAMAMMSGS